MSDKKKAPSFLCSQILLNEQLTSVLKYSDFMPLVP